MNLYSVSAQVSILLSREVLLLVFRAAGHRSAPLWPEHVTK